MSRTPQFSVSWEEFIDNLIEENKKLKKDLEFVYGWKDQLEKENKNLKEENELLKEELWEITGKMY